MPKRVSRNKKTLTSNFRSGASSFSGQARFRVGDVVLHSEEPERIGTVCWANLDGSSYHVKYADEKQCIEVTEDSLVAAGPGVEGPECTPDCMH